MTATHPPVTLDQRASRSDEVLSQEVGGETVLLDLASEQYFGLDPIGTRIWELLADAPPLEQVHATLCAEFEAEPERIRADLLALMQQLRDAGLARVT